ncbi:D-hexose-6-phosphate mutarotase [Chitinimonas lacunae]|uniref:Putative glucose-6-phosphate 1-epimerase n=1 Tax=Chitinimonas lacunae TaxID=1963018 RepID=A0ABV8MMR4_9NEIS
MQQPELPSAVMRWVRRGEIDLIEIDHPVGRGLVSRQGAQLLDWQATDQPPLIWLSPATRFEAGRPLRGGIPLCWPWFGPRPGLPAHGLVRQRNWRLEAASHDPEGCTLRWRLDSDPEQRALWPHDFELVLTMRLGLSIKLSLAMRVPNDIDEPVSFAFHSYLALPDVRTATVDGLSGSIRHDKLSNGAPTAQCGIFQPGKQCDSVFTDASGRYVLQRAPWPALRIEAENCPSAIVWTPGEQGAAAMADMADWSGMLCVETGAALADGLRLQAGQWHRVVTRIGVVEA